MRLKPSVKLQQGSQTQGNFSLKMSNCIGTRTGISKRGNDTLMSQFQDGPTGVIHKNES